MESEDKSCAKEEGGGKQASHPASYQSVGEFT